MNHLGSTEAYRESYDPIFRDEKKKRTQESNALGRCFSDVSKISTAKSRVVVMTVMHAMKALMQESQISSLSSKAVSILTATESKGGHQILQMAAQCLQEKLNRDDEVDYKPFIDKA